MMKKLVFLIAAIGFGFAAASGNVGYAGEAALGVNPPSFGVLPVVGLDYAAFDCWSFFPSQGICLYYEPGIVQLYEVFTQ